MSSVLPGAVLAFLAAGCGLSHYQQQMAEEQARLARIDEERKNLADPLQLPDKKDRPPYFFRPPVRIASTGVPHESNVLQRFGLVGSDPSYFQDVAFGVERMKEDDFWSSLLRSFSTKKKEDAVVVAKETPGRGKMSLKELKSDDGQVFLYVWSQGDLHAAVIYRLTRANDPTARSLMDMSLGTLTVGADASRAHKAYQEWKKYLMEAKRKEAAAQSDR